MDTNEAEINDILQTNYSEFRDDFFENFSDTNITHFAQDKENLGGNANCKARHSNESIDSFKSQSSVKIPQNKSEHKIPDAQSLKNDGGCNNSKKRSCMLEGISGKFPKTSGTNTLLERFSAITDEDFDVEPDYPISKNIAGCVPSASTKSIIPESRMRLINIFKTNSSSIIENTVEDAIIGPISEKTDRNDARINNPPNSSGNTLPSNLTLRAEGQTLLHVNSVSDVDMYNPKQFLDIVAQQSHKHISESNDNSNNCYTSDFSKNSLPKQSNNKQSSSGNISQSTPILNSVNGPVSDLIEEHSQSRLENTRITTGKERPSITVHSGAKVTSAPPSRSCRLTPHVSVKPKFPGPAGLLPNVAVNDLQNMEEILSSYEEELNKKKPEQQPSAPVTLGPLWHYMLQDLDLDPADPYCIINRYNIWRSVLQSSSSGGGGATCGSLRRIPLLLVQVTAITPSHSQASLLLNDHTGEVTGLLSSSAVSRYLPVLCCGCCLLLTTATVWQAASRPPVLSVIDTNVAAVYAPLNSAAADQSASFDVKITSGLTVEERKQLRHKLALNNILERSLVEESNEFRHEEIPSDGFDDSAGNFSDNKTSREYTSGNMHQTNFSSNFGQKTNQQYQNPYNSLNKSNVVERSSNNLSNSINNTGSNNTGIASGKNVGHLPSNATNFNYRGPNLSNETTCQFSPIVSTNNTNMNSTHMTRLVPNVIGSALSNITKADSNNTGPSGCDSKIIRNCPGTSVSSAASDSHANNMQACSTPLRPILGAKRTTTGKFTFKSNISQGANLASNFVPNSPAKSCGDALKQFGRNDATSRGVTINCEGFDVHAVKGGHVTRTASKAVQGGAGVSNSAHTRAAPSEKELKEIKELMDQFASEDFDDF